MTVGAMADFGYTVDLTAADPFSLPEIPGPQLVGDAAPLLTPVR